ncbi:MAG: group I intron-associated PD-(D/E)XK endonuclease [Candidatus Sulfotelmatobacter sp.]
MALRDPRRLHFYSTLKGVFPGAATRCAIFIMSATIVVRTQNSRPNLERQPITIHAVSTPTRKRRGEAAEAAFLARATHLGFTVLIPWGDSNRYDSVVELDRGFLRVQVKSATGYAEHRYRVKTTGASGQVYTSKEIDFFVAYVVPENLWYIIPIQAVGSRKAIRFYPTTRRPSRALFEKYRESWCLLDSCLSVRLRKSDPRRCRSKNLPSRCALCPQRG